jgi:ligand-binding sensor domain-containing protein
MFAFGADGQVWIARSDTSKLTRVKPDGTNATDFSLLSGGSPDSSANYEMLLAADGNIWFTSQNGLGRVTSSGSITIFTQTSVDNLIASVGGMWVSGYSTLISVANDGTQTLYSNTCDGRIASSTSDTIWCAGRGYNEGVRLFFTTPGTGATSVTKNVFINTKGNFTGIGGLVADTAGRIWYINGSKVGFIVP